MPPPYHYVYILRSQSNPSHHYIGATSDLRQRLHAHNAGQSKHTAKHRPWFIETAIAFRSKEKASAFESYLKSGSGRGFATRHL
ncbi:MAG: excinuclease ABC subunit C [Gammaproteobacteria bacterium]|nr:excinuclease ABC subunit C [Gammaproteobacteria bacterium]MBK81152.1 excinuclease ABC subunit C [Gammaproteobacteria bacterium]|tara:strand:- start:6522 stop:6773 length:252 start_codon:yes stop_codon:yes gene_type:complete